MLRRNPARAEELAASRQDQLTTLRTAGETANKYLREHPRAAAKTQLSKLKARAKTLHIDRFVQVAAEQRSVALTVDQEALTELARLDGCYALRTDLPKAVVSKDVVHDRYKDLTRVEWAFRDSKSVHLEMRPVYLRAENRTRGDTLVVMLAYLMAQELRQRWRDSDMTVKGGTHRLAGLCVTEVRIGGRPSYHQVPKPRDDVRRFLRRQHRHPHRAAARPGPSSHQEETPTTSKSEINTARYLKIALASEGEHPLQSPSTGVPKAPLSASPIAESPSSWRFAVWPRPPAMGTK